MHPDDTNVFASNVIDKYENQPDDLHSMCLADFASSYISNKADDLLIEPDEIKSFNRNIIVLKNELGEMWKRDRLCVIRFHKVSKLESPEEHY